MQTQKKNEVNEVEAPAKEAQRRLFEDGLDLGVAV